MNHMLAILSSSVFAYLSTLYAAHIFDNDDLKMKFANCFLIGFMIEFVFVLIGYH